MDTAYDGQLNMCISLSKYSVLREAVWSMHIHHRRSRVRASHRSIRGVELKDLFCACDKDQQELGGAAT